MTRSRRWTMLAALLLLLTLAGRGRAYPGYYTLPEDDSAAKRGDRPITAPTVLTDEQERFQCGDIRVI